MSRKKSLETSLVLTVAFMTLYFLKSNEVFLYIAFSFGLTGIFIKPLAKIIAVGWFKMAEMLSFVVSKIVLGAVFFLILFPISVFYRIAKKDSLRMQPNGKSTWIDRDYKYSKQDLENIW